MNCMVIGGIFPYIHIIVKPSGRTGTKAIYHALFGPTPLGRPARAKHSEA